MEEVRFPIFMSCLCAFLLLELYLPWRKRPVGRHKRWFQNISLTVIGAMVTRFTLGAVPIWIAVEFTEKGYGLLPFLGISGFIAIIFTYLIMDLIIYWQHRIFHTNAFFWKYHRVHHSDPDLDVTSGFRFHPLEIFFSLIIKTIAVAIIGASPEGVLVFEILLSSGALFNHSNFIIPESWEPKIRAILVTPRMHLIHHSTRPREFNSNYGFIMSIWDRLFGSYTEAPKKPYESMAIGLTQFNSSSQLDLVGLLKMPFQK